jgi:hypothetical protein
MDSKGGAKMLCGVELDRQPSFQVVDGSEKYKVVDLVTGGESFFDEKIHAYRMMSFLINVLRHNYRLEVR